MESTQPLIQPANKLSMTKPDVGRGSYSVNDLCERHDVGRTLIYAEMNSGRLEFIKVRSVRRVTPSQEQRWLERLAAETKAASPTP